MSEKSEAYDKAVAQYWKAYEKARGQGKTYEEATAQAREAYEKARASE